MTVPVSTAPAVMTYLLSAIQAQVDTDPLVASMLVKLGELGANIPNDYICVSGAVNRRLAPANFIGGGGEDWENERYDITVYTSSWVASGDSDDSSTVATQINDRMWQLVAYVETAVRNDPSCGSLVDIAYPAVTLTEGPVWDDDNVGLLAQATLTIHVERLI